MIDRILVRFNRDFEYFLPSVSVVHEYIMQVQGQGKHFIFTIEMGDESQLFFSSLFPRMDIRVGDGEKRSRWDWDCVLDFRNTERPMNIAIANKKHVTEAWGILFGGSPGIIPQLGYLGARVKREEIGILIDSEIECAELLLTYFQHTYPLVVTVVDRVNGLRLGTMFDKLCGTKMYIGKRSGATYLAATMGKGLVELYPDDMPPWWLRKPTSDRYRMVWQSFSPELILTFGEEIWQTICSTTFPKGTLMDKPVSTAEPVSVR